MLGGLDSGTLLHNIIKIQGGKKGIEVGVYTGFTTYTMAKALPDDGKILALDISREFTGLGEKMWEKGGVRDKIDLRLGDAVESFDKLIEDPSNHNSFDFAFVDADKKNYPVYYEKLLILLKKGGWIAFDNAFAKGGVWGDSSSTFSDEDIKAIKQVNDTINNDDKVYNVLLTIADGINIVVKK